MSVMKTMNALWYNLEKVILNFNFAWTVHGQGDLADLNTILWCVLMHVYMYVVLAKRSMHNSCFDNYGLDGTLLEHHHHHSGRLPT